MPVVQIDTKPHFPAHKIYDPAAPEPVQGADADHSLVARVPRIITIEAMAGGTTVAVQGKVHNDAAWETIVVLDGATAAVQSTTFDPRWNFVQLVRTGAKDMVAYAQL